MCTILGAVLGGFAASAIMPKASTPSYTATAAPAAAAASATSPDVTAAVQATRRLNATRAGIASTITNAGNNTTTPSLLSGAASGYNTGTKALLGGG